MNTHIIAALIIVVVVIAVILLKGQFFASPPVAEQITYEQLPAILTKLKTSTNPTDFVGYCTKNEDALYFVFENGVYNLDYELFSPDKLAYEQAFSDFAKQHGYTLLETQYFNDSPKVLRIPLTADETDAVNTAYKFGQTIWGHSLEMKYELLP